MSSGRAIGLAATIDEEPGTQPGSSVKRAIGRAGLTTLVLLGVGAGPVASHGGGPMIEPTPIEVAAGDFVTVIGDDLSPDVSGTFHLLTGRGEIVVARAEFDAVGHVTVAVQVPGDLPPRIYELRMTDDLGIHISTFITVVEGPPDQGGSLLRLAIAVAGASIAIGVLIWALRARVR